MPRAPMPTLGPEPKKSPLPKVLLVAVLVGLVASGIYWWRSDDDAPETTPAAAADPGPAVAETPQASVDPGTPTVAAEPAPRPPSREELLAKSGLKAATAIIQGPLETAVVDAVGREVGPALTQVVTRTLVWWVEVPSDLLRGDRLDVLYEERRNDEPLVHAVRFESSKHGRTFEAYLFQPASEPYPRFYEPSGEELELRLQDAPIDTYEQITSLLRDGRRHKGVDFKAPVGTPVKATFDGTITRRNWNFRGNGNSLEIQEAGGRRKALFLHLDELPSTVRVGMKVKRGQVIAKSGNTGRSFAPHLHYQLMLGDRVLDPFVEHATFRRTLPASERAAFEAEVRRMQALLAPPMAQTP